MAPERNEERVDERVDGREKRKRKREIVAIFGLIALFLLLTFLEFRLTKVSSTLPFVNSIFFFGLLNVNIILLIAVVWLVTRNVGKVFIERRSNVLGSRLKTKLVVAFLGFSITPTLVLFFISALYINSSFDKWFSLKIQNTLEASLEITRTYYRNTDQTALHFAEHIAASITSKVDEPGEAPKALPDFLSAQRDLLALDAVEFYSDSLDERLIARKPQGGGPDFYPRLAFDLLDRAFAGEKVSVIQHIGSGDLIRVLVPVRPRGAANQKVLGVVAVNSYIPVSLVNKVDEIASVFEDYKDVNPLKYPMKTAYLVILVMITLVIIFVAIWIGLYMARELTVPVERLVAGAREVGAGNLDISVKSSGHDEITVLVDSFNKMTRDLRDSRANLIRTGEDLDRRKRELEAVLGNIGTGVLALDHTGVLTTLNPAAARLLGMDRARCEGANAQEVLVGDASPLLPAVTRALDGVPSEVPQWNVREGEAHRVLSAMVTPLRQSDRSWGAVAVIDDISHLVKDQREMAWREVARRIAHEIKNPLTPIKLSAQRIQRRFGDYGGRDGAILKECTDTIVRHTDELKEMVNEFSNFARFPEITLAPNDLNAAMSEVLKLYEQAHATVMFDLRAESGLPTFEFDRDQIKRVIINLLDNAVAALSSGTSGPPKVSIATHYNQELQMAVVEIQDNGPGMPESVLARVFEPYFSTKATGTGLGLAIAKRIVNDHDGFIRVQSEPGQGTRFLIELPTTRPQKDRPKTTSLEAPQEGFKTTWQD